MRGVEEWQTNPSEASIYIMEEKFQQLQALFGNDKPKVKIFRAKLAKLSKRKQKVILHDTYMLAVGYWNELPTDYQKFLKQLIRNNRQDWLDFLLSNTILGELRYAIQRPELFFAMMRIVELSERTNRVSIEHLSMNTLTVFKFKHKKDSLKISTLGEYYQNAMIDVKAVALLIGKYERFEDVYVG